MPRAANGFRLITMKRLTSFHPSIDGSGERQSDQIEIQSVAVTAASIAAAATASTTIRRVRVVDSDIRLR